MYRDTNHDHEPLNIPGLQQRGSRQCVRCGRASDAYCAGCGVTPYCGGDCQRRDWRDRHRDVCHNLSRQPSSVDNDCVDIQPVSPSAAPLRRPRSPVAHGSKGERARRDDDAGPADRPRPDNKPQGQGKQRNFKPKGGYCSNMRRPQVDGARQRPERDGHDEDWDNKNDVKKEPVQQSPVHTPKQPPQAAKEVQKIQQEPVNSTGPQCLASEPAKLTPEASPATDVKAPVSVADVTPMKKRPTLVPASYLMENLAIGDLVLLSVESPASECRAPRSGFVCLSMHEKYETEYQRLCEDYVVDCEADTSEYSVTPGETFSYFNPLDGGWYRARCLTPALAALLDGSKVVPLAASDKCKRLTDKYSATPEFCCLLDAESAQIGQNLKCTIVSKTKDGYRVSLEDVAGGAALGAGEVARWLPEVDYPQPKPNSTQGPVIPDVQRPPVRRGATMLLVEAAAADRVLLRPADADSQRRFDSIVQNVAVYGTTATALKKPPVKGSTVIAKFADGLHYRALVKRTNVKQNKYLLEYIEFGNSDIAPLENLYPCPQEMTITTVPTEVSVVKVPLKHALTAKAQKYLEDMKDQELVVTLPDGVLSAPSGSEATLTLAKTNECVNSKLDEMCKPEWMKLEERGGDVVEIKPIMYPDLQYLELAAGGCTVEVLDHSMLLDGGELSACPKGAPQKEYVSTTLRQRMTEYCNSDIGREPYLPKIEELCIAKDSETGTWHRAVLMDQESGAGGGVAQVYYIDRGSTERLPVAALRKILPEFVDGLPAVALALEVTGYPAKPTPSVISRANAFLNRCNNEMRVSNCTRREPGLYTVDAPELIAAIGADQ